MIKLRNYQLKALKKIKNGNILRGDVGSGKSLTSLAYYYLMQGGSLAYLKGGKYKYLNNPQNLYIITTAKKRNDKEWEKELSHFKMSSNPDDNYYSNEVIVDSWNNIKKYVDVSRSFFIFDEQRLVGNGTWVKTFYKIARRNKWILLSATPGDEYKDYVPILIANGYFKNLYQFEYNHVIFNRYVKYKQIDRYINIDILDRMIEEIEVPMEYQGAAELHHIDIICDFDRKKYATVGKTRWDPYNNEPIKTKAKLCYLWRRISNEDTSRQLELLKLHNKHPKLIVFYNHQYERDILMNLEYQENTIIAEYNSNSHDDIPNSDKWIYLVQYTAGCEGWNCIETDVTVFYSQSYSYKQTHQASGRINRMNTPYKDLYYYHFKSLSPIDLGISLCLKNKKQFNETRFISKSGIDI